MHRQPQEQLQRPKPGNTTPQLRFKTSINPHYMAAIFEIIKNFKFRFFFLFNRNFFFTISLCTQLTIKLFLTKPLPDQPMTYLVA